MSLFILKALSGREGRVTMKENPITKVPADMARGEPEIDRAKDLWENNVYQNVSILVDKLYENQLIQRYPQEDVIEWYSVSDWLAGQLRDHGEFVIEYAGLQFWGRTTTGQSAWLDHSIQQIYDDWRESTF